MHNFDQFFAHILCANFPGSKFCQCYLVSFFSRPSPKAGRELQTALDIRDDGGREGPLSKNDRSPGRESTQRLCTCFIYNDTYKEMKIAGTLSYNSNMQFLFCLTLGIVDFNNAGIGVSEAAAGHLHYGRVPANTNTEHLQYSRVPANTATVHTLHGGRTLNLPSL